MDDRRPAPIRIVVEKAREKGPDRQTGGRKPAIAVEVRSVVQLGERLRVDERRVRERWGCALVAVVLDFCSAY